MEDINQIYVPEMGINQVLSQEDIIKEITPENFKDYSNSQLISLIEKNNSKFFKNINLDVLRLIGNEVISSISKHTFKKLTKGDMEKLVQTGQIKYCDDKFLNYINPNLYETLSNKFFKSLKKSQFISLKNEILIKRFIKDNKKIECLNEEVLESFYKEKSFMELKLDINDISYLLNILKSKKKFKFNYLSIDNFNYLEKFIEKDEINDYLEELKKVKFSEEENNNINTHPQNDVLDRNDIKFEEETNIIDISKEINYYLDDDDYDSLKKFCIKCSQEENDREVVINTLKNILNNSSNEFYEYIKKIDILRILIFVDKNKDNVINYYFELINKIHQIHNIEIFHPDEFNTRTNRISQIIREGLFNDDFLEILAEENFKSIKLLLNEKFTGTDKNAIPEYLRYKYIDIINDYLDVLKSKYKIKEDKIIENLKDIDGEGDKKEMELKLKFFLKSLDEKEKLYYDLLMQSIIDMPSLENDVEAKVTTIFKFIRDIGITLIATKYASITGSKTLAFLTASLGAAKLIKNITHEIANSYYSCSDEQRNICHKNQRNLPKSTFEILKRKMIHYYKKVAVPIKKSTNNFIRYKILKLKEEPKIGFERIPTDYFNQRNAYDACMAYRNKDIKNYINNLMELNEEKYNTILKLIKEKYNNKNIKTRKPTKLSKFVEVKEKMIRKLIKIKGDKLNNDYPEFVDSISNKVSQITSKVSSVFKGFYNGVVNALTYSLIDLRIKRSDRENRADMIKSLRYKKYREDLDKFNKFVMKCEKELLEQDIKELIKYSYNDTKIYNELIDNKRKEKIKIKNIEKKFQIVDNEIKNLNINNINNDINKDDNDNGQIKLDDLIEPFIGEM